MLKKRTIRALHQALEDRPTDHPDRQRMLSTRQMKTQYEPVERERFKKVILEQKEQVDDDLHALERSLQSEDRLAREEAAMLMDRQVRFLRYLNAALERVEEDDYGKCKTCGDLIHEGRLLAVPHTILCLTCKTGGVVDRQPVFVKTVEHPDRSAA